MQLETSPGELNILSLLVDCNTSTEESDLDICSPVTYINCTPVVKFPPTVVFKWNLPSIN